MKDAEGLLVEVKTKISVIEELLQVESPRPLEYSSDVRCGIGFMLLEIKNQVEQIANQDR